MKICRRCDIEKPKAEFFKQKHMKDNLCSWCKQCKRDYQRTHDYRAKAKIYEASEAGKFRQRKYRSTEKYKTSRCVKK